MQIETSRAACVCGSSVWVVMSFLMSTKDKAVCQGASIVKICLKGWTPPANSTFNLIRWLHPSWPHFLHRLLCQALAGMPQPVCPLRYQVSQGHTALQWAWLYWPGHTHTSSASLARAVGLSGRSLQFPGIFLPQEKTLCAEVCCFTVSWARSGAAPLGNWHVVELTACLNLTITQSCESYQLLVHFATPQAFHCLIFKLQHSSQHYFWYPQRTESKSSVVLIWN